MDAEGAPRTGGNGSVWLASNSTSQDAAIKILAKMRGAGKGKAYSRLRDEVKVLAENCDILGLLPIIDFQLPEDISKEMPWYVMPVAEPFARYLKGKTFEVTVRGVLAIGQTLTELHERGVYHRDVKPPNILVKDGQYFLADFGLVDYPGKAKVTKTKEQVGAKWTIAPEMRRAARRADGGPADVYALAKTLWILLKGRSDGFEGRYDADGPNGLRYFGLKEPEGENWYFSGEAPALYTKPLDDLLTESTDDRPAKRPTIGQFVQRLKLWIELYGDHRKRNPLEWAEVQAKLFPLAVPERVVWSTVNEIVSILDYLGSIHALNHMLLPGGGGMDLVSARVGWEPGTVELQVGVNTVYLVRPKRLLFESFGFDTEWNYFRLETDRLKPTGVGSVVRNHGHYEPLVEIAPQEYISQESWQNRSDYEDRQLSRRTRSLGWVPRYVERFLAGDFVVFQKTSIYNRITYTYDGRHEQMGTDEFRGYIKKTITAMREFVEKPEVKRIAEQRGVPLEDAAEYYVNRAFRQDGMTRFGRGRRDSSQMP